MTALRGLSGGSGGGAVGKSKTSMATLEAALGLVSQRGGALFATVRRLADCGGSVALETAFDDDGDGDACDGNGAARKKSKKEKGSGSRAVKNWVQKVLSLSELIETSSSSTAGARGGPLSSKFA
jgi:hypothetical protein